MSKGPCPDAATSRFHSLAEASFILGVGVVFVLLCGYFARFQSVWVDETTQLSGLRLGPLQQVSWLINAVQVDFGVPDDRMPPLSYFLGWIWSRTFGLSENVMRWFGICCVSVGLVPLWLAGRLVAPRWGAAFAVVSFALSANVITVAGEIRCYPLFLSLSCLIAYLFVQCYRRSFDDRLWMTLLAISLVGGMYTHFYGVVMGAAVWGTIVIYFLIQRRRLTRLFIWIVPTLICSAGLLPFIAASAANSSTGASAEGDQATLREVVRLLYRMVGHPAAFASRWGLLLLVGGACGLCVLIVVALMQKRRDAFARPRESAERQIATCLLSVIGLGLGIPIVASRFVGAFQVLTPAYSVWCLPFVALLFGSLFASPGRRMFQIMRITCAGMLIVGSVLTTQVIMRYPVVYSHGPSEWLAKMVESSDAPVTMLHDAQGEWGFIYFPMYFLLGDNVHHFLWSEDRQIYRIRRDGLDPVEVSRGQFPDVDTRMVMWVSARNLSATQLATAVRGQEVAAVNHQEDFGALGITPEKRVRFISYIEADVTAMRREFVAETNKHRVAPSSTEAVVDE